MENKPLAERMRPKTLDDYIGQKHLVGEGKVLRKMIESGVVSSFILWGPPGVGKTTLAMIIAEQLERPFYVLSAVSSGVKDVREVIQKAESQRFFNTPNPILFIDEIHRFSKAQQDSLLAAVEKGTVTLIGATTENPSFEVISPLLSRCQVYVLKAQEKADLEELIDKALTKDFYLKEKNIPVWIRHVVVPGITLQEKYLRQLGAYLAGLDNLKALDVLPYHTMGEVKYENLGIPYPLKGVEPATTEQAIWARNTILDALKEQLRKEKFGE